MYVARHCAELFCEWLDGELMQGKYSLDSVSEWLHLWVQGFGAPEMCEDHAIFLQTLLVLSEDPPELLPTALPLFAREIGALERYEWIAADSFHQAVCASRDFRRQIERRKDRATKPDR